MKHIRASQFCWISLVCRGRQVNLCLIWSCSPWTFSTVGWTAAEEGIQSLASTCWDAAPLSSRSGFHASEQQPRTWAVKSVLMFRGKNISITEACECKRNLAAGFIWFLQILMKTLEEEKIRRWRFCACTQCHICICSCRDLQNK